MKQRNWETKQKIIDILDEFTKRKGELGSNFTKMANPIYYVNKILDVIDEEEQKIKSKIY